MKLTVRPAFPDDIDLLTRMNILLRADERMDNVMTDDEVRQRMLAMAGGGYTALLFSDARQSVVGYTLTDHTRRPMYLRQLFVNRDFRKMGCGRQMIDLTMRHLQTAELDIEVMAWNDDARAFYRKIGCRERYIGLRYRMPE